MYNGSISELTIYEIAAIWFEGKFKMRGQDRLILEYIYLAAGCFAVGVIITFAVLFICQYFRVDITENIWILTIPVILSIVLNIFFIELYRKYRKK